MAWGINYYGKKAAQLMKHEHELLVALQEQRGAEAVQKAAAEVRAAHIRVLKSRAAQLEQSERHAATFAKLEQEMARWAKTPLEELIEEFRQKAAEGSFVYDRKHRRGAW